MYDYRNNEDAGDLGAMGAADASVMRRLYCHECGAFLDTAEDFEPGECDSCGEDVTWENVAEAG